MGLKQVKTLLLPWQLQLGSPKAADHQNEKEAFSQVSQRVQERWGMWVEEEGDQELFTQQELIMKTL